MKNFQEIEKARFLTQVDFFKVTLDKTPTDKLSWKPDGKSMSAQEMTEHLTGSNYFFAALIKGEAPPSPPKDAPQNKTREQIAQEFQMSCEMMAKTINSVSDQSLDKPITLPFGKSVKTSFLMTVPGSHMAYHWGQLSYVQKMFGDDQDHFIKPEFALGSRY